MIEFKDVKIIINKKMIVEKMSFKVEDNKICCVFGLNGSGKTTVLRAINGLTEYTGEILINDQNIKTLKNLKKAQMIAYFPQQLPHVKDISVRDLVSFGRMPYNRYTNKLSQVDQNIITKALEQLQINDLSDRLVDTLSGGEKQKVFFAMLLAQDANNILLDEPMNNLDINNRQVLLDYLQLLKKAGKTVIVVLHEITEMMRVADEILIIHNVNNKKVYHYFKSKEDFINSGLLEKYYNLKLINFEKENLYIPVKCQ